MNRCRLALTCCLCSLWLAGCLEMVRRPQVIGALGQSATSATADTLAAGPRLDRSAAAGVAPANGSRKPVPTMLVESVQALAGPPDQSPAPPTHDIRRLNEYAWWCVNQGLWNEARSHLERALAQDSLSASLHNNLAVVYEHFGLHEQAALHYQRAQELNPGRSVYPANLERMQQLRQAAADTTVQFDGLDLRDRGSSSERDPFRPAAPRTPGD